MMAKLHATTELQVIRSNYRRAKKRLDLALRGADIHLHKSGHSRRLWEVAQRLDLLAQDIESLNLTAKYANDHKASERESIAASLQEMWRAREKS